MATPEEQRLTMIANLPEKTGRSIEEWMAVLKGREGEKHGQLVKHLKTDHGVSHGFANLIVHVFRAGDVEAAVSPGPGRSADGDDLVAAQYEKKQELLPIYQAVLKVVEGFGDDVEVAPKKSYVSLRRTTQFALVQPSTKTRVDLGIKLRDREPAGRLEASGSFNSMVTHRVRLTSADEVDEEVRGWLREAYEEN